MNRTSLITGFDLPYLDQSDKLQRVLSCALKNNSSSSFTSVQNRGFIPYWNAQYFHLDQVRLFQQATLEEQNAILQLASQSLLEEAYFIEKAGVSYMAKMLMWAETNEERMLYALFSADETYHLAQIMSFLPDYQPVGIDNTFWHFLADIVEQEDKMLILFVLQVVLEGWGLTHYNSLAHGCQNAEFSQVLRGFLHDESRHHAIGLTLLEKNTLPASSQQLILETLTLFLQMIQLSSKPIIHALEQVLGHLSYPQKVQIFEELDTRNHTGNRLKTFHSLIAKGNQDQIMKLLEARGVFQPLSNYSYI